MSACAFTPRRTNVHERALLDCIDLGFFSHLSQTSETETGSSRRLSDMSIPHCLGSAGRLSQYPQ